MGTRKKILVTTVLTALLTMTTALFVFGHYLPNKPENVWNKGLERSGVAFTKLIEASAEEETLGAFERGELSIAASGKIKDIPLQANLHAKFDKATTEGTLKMNMTEDDSNNLHVDFLSNQDPVAMLPAMYFKASGLDTAMLPEGLLLRLQPFENKWIAAKEPFWGETLKMSTPRERRGESEISTEETAALLRAIQAPTLEYIFTTNDKKAVLQKKEFVGKEEVEDQKTYQYAVTINQENAAQYCTALTNSIQQTKGYQKLQNRVGADTSAENDQQKKNCEERSRTFSEETTVHIWINQKTKLIQKIHLAENDPEGSFFTITQRYDGGKTIDFIFESFHAETALSSTLHATIDFDTHTSEGQLHITNESDTDTTLTFDTKPLENDIRTKAPANPIPIEGVLENLLPSSSR